MDDCKPLVNGPNAHPVWQFLKEARPAVHHVKPKPRDAVKSGGDDITWNFNKFLVGRDGRPVKRYPPAWDEVRRFRLNRWNPC